MTIRMYKGSARATYLTGPLDASAMTIPTNGLTGWPDGSIGPFYAVINRSKPNEEKILCSAISGNDLIVEERGADDTAAQNHGDQSVIEHVITATDARQANHHVNDFQAHIQDGTTAERDALDPADLFPGQAFYATDTQILWLWAPSSEWLATSAHPRLVEDLDMQGLYQVKNLVDPTDAQDAATMSWVELQVPTIIEPSVELAKEWAIKMDGKVEGEDYSSKYYATESGTSATASASSASEAEAFAGAAEQFKVDTGLIYDDAVELWNNFQDRYMGPFTEAPDPPNPQGALYYNTSDYNMYVWSGYEWLIASTAVTSTFVEYDFTALAGQTLFNTPERINPEFTQVFLNGIFLPQTDFTAEANSITLDEGANAGDSVVVVSYQEAAYAPGGGGTPGPAGKSAYEIWLDEGNSGSEQDFLDSLVGPQGPDGLSAYEVAVKNGYVGTESEWLASLDGTDGASAYEIAVANGFVGSEQAWLDSLQGTPGTGIQVMGEVATVDDLAPLVATASLGDAYLVLEDNDLWVFDDTGKFINFGDLQGPQGPAGQSAYEVWLAAGNTGTVDDYLASLTGPPGPQGDAFTYDDFTEEQLEGLEGPAGPPGPATPLPLASEASLVLTSTGTGEGDYDWAEGGGGGLDFDSERDAQLIQGDGSGGWAPGMALKVVQDLPADDDPNYAIGDAVFVLGDVDPKGSGTAWGDFTTSGDEQDSGTYTDTAGRDWKWAEWNVAADYSVSLTGGMYHVLCVGGGDAGWTSANADAQQGQPGTFNEGYWEFPAGATSITVGSKSLTAMSTTSFGMPSSIGGYGTQGMQSFGHALMGRGATTSSDPTGYRSSITGTSLEYATGYQGTDRPGRAGRASTTDNRDGCVIIATVTNEPSDWNPPGTLPGIGGWADVATITGTGTKYEYTADGEDWTSFAWTADGSVTTTGGLLDALIVAGGAGTSGDGSIRGSGGGVITGVEVFAAGELSIVVGAGGDNSGSATSGMGQYSQLGETTRIAGGTRGISPNGYQRGDNGSGYYAGAGSAGDGEGRTTGGIGVTTSLINGTSVMYASGGGDYRPPDDDRPGDGGHGDAQPSSGYAMPGVDGIVAIRVPRASDKTGLPAGPFDTTTLREKAAAAVKEVVKNRRAKK